jgi:hypothetical protein
MESNKLLKTLKEQQDNSMAKDEEFDGEVLISQGFNHQTLGENGLLRCRQP